MVAIITCGGQVVEVVKSATVTRKASDIVTTAHLEIKANYLGALQNLGEVAIEYDGRVLFHGIAGNPILNFSGTEPTMSISCVDLSLKLSSMVVGTTATTYTSGTDIGAVVYALLADTGIDRTHINQTTGTTLAADLVIPPGEYRMKWIQYIARKYDCMFYLSYANAAGTYTTFGEFNTYSAQESSEDFTESHSLTETNVITFNMGQKTAPEMICTRVIAVWTRAGEYKIGTATAAGVSSPYIDKVVRLNADDYDADSDLDAVAANYLAYYQNSVNRVYVTLRGLPVGLFNQINASGVSLVYGENLAFATFRISEAVQKITSSGILTYVQGVPTDADLWELGVRDASSDHELATLIRKEALYQSEQAKPKYATVSGTPIEVTTGVYAVPIEYPDGRTETVDLPENYDSGTILAVTERDTGEKIASLVSVTSSGGGTSNRGLFGGGSERYGTADFLTSILDMVTISTAGMATHFGDLTFSRYMLGACSSSTRGVYAGGSNIASGLSVIDFITIATMGNCSGFGSLVSTKYNVCGCSSSTIGVFAGGYNGSSYLTDIDYITIATTGNATDFGNLTIGRRGAGACSSPTRGVIGGGFDGGYYNVIDYITFASVGDATDFGDLTESRYNLAACSSSTRGLYSGGTTGSVSSTIDYITIDTTGTSTNFGDLTVARYGLAACSSATYGVFGGGYISNRTNAMDVVTIATTGNAVNFGDLTQPRQSPAACSNSHGGLA